MPLVVLVQGHDRGDAPPDPWQSPLDAFVIAQHQQVRSGAPQPTPCAEGSGQVQHGLHMGIALPEFGFDVSPIRFLVEQDGNPNGQLCQGGHLLDEHALAAAEAEFAMCEDHMLHGIPHSDHHKGIAPRGFIWMSSNAIGQSPQIRPAPGR